jgi:two-component system cell cycle response regulator
MGSADRGKRLHHWVFGGPWTYSDEGWHEPTGEDAGWAARMGGEEFLLVFPGTGIDEATRRCEEVRQAIESFPWDGVMRHGVVTVSIGVTARQAGRTTQAALLGQADRNLYAAKHGGRNRVVADLV